jgi:hypothetical protein
MYYFNTPRVVKDMQGMTKKMFLEDKRLGVVTDIVLQNSSNNKLILAGSMGAIFTDSEPAKFVQFDKRQDSNFIQLKQGSYGFMNRGAGVATHA